MQSACRILECQTWRSIGFKRLMSKLEQNLLKCFIINAPAIASYKSILPGQHACKKSPSKQTPTKIIYNIALQILLIFSLKYFITDQTVLISRDQNAGRSHSMKTDNSSIERVEEFKYLGTTLTNRNSIQEEIKSRLKLGNAC